MLQTGGVTSRVVSMTRLVRVVLVQPVLHAQMMRMLVEMKMMMSDHSFRRQLATPLSLVCHCWTFVVIDDKGGERLIKALGFLFHLFIFVPGDMYCRQ